MEQKVKINGYRLREALSHWRTQRDVQSKLFNESLFAFEDESKEPAIKVTEAFELADKNTALLEDAQQQYNQMVTVTLEGEKVSLSRLIKMIGGTARLEKMWRAAALDSGRDRYSSRDTRRSAGEIVANRTISVNDCIERAKRQARQTARIRCLIAEANSVEREIEWLNSDLFK